MDEQPAADDLADASLLAALKAGDESAYRQLVVRYHGRLVGLAASVVGPVVGRRDLAEDAVQETWVAVLRGVGAFEGRSSLRAWLFQVCANRARSLASREQRQPLVVDHDWVTTVDAAVDAPPETGDTDQLVLRVRLAIDALPARQRRVVLLRDVDGLSAAEAGRTLGLTDANQRVLLHRGRAGVRRRLVRAAEDRACSPA